MLMELARGAAVGGGRELEVIGVARVIVRFGIEDEPTTRLRSVARLKESFGSSASEGSSGSGPGSRGCNPGWSPPRSRRPGWSTSRRRGRRGRSPRSCPSRPRTGSGRRCAVVEPEVEVALVVGEVDPDEVADVAGADGRELEPVVVGGGGDRQVGQGRRALDLAEVVRRRQAVVRLGPVAGRVGQGRDDQREGVARVGLADDPDVVGARRETVEVDLLAVARPVRTSIRRLRVVELQVEVPSSG